MLNASFFSRSACKSVALVALMSMGLVACDQTAETTEMTLDSQEQRISYGIAMNMGRRMKAEGVPIDADAFAEGLRDALSGAEAKMTDDEINAEMIAMQEQMQRMEQDARAANARTQQAVAELREDVVNIRQDVARGSRVMTAL